MIVAMLPLLESERERAILVAFGVLVAVGILAAFAVAAAVRRRVETRIRILELLARGAARSVPLPTLVLRAAAEAPRRLGLRLRGLAARLSEGESLGAALRALDPALMPSHVAAAAGAAEGTRHLAPTLRALADDETRGLARRRQLGLVMLYPTMLALTLLALHDRVAVLFGDPWFARSTLFDFAYDAVFVLVLAGVVFQAFGGTRRRLGGLLATGHARAARLLRLSGILLEAGLPLSEAVHRAGGTDESWIVSNRACRAARALGSGEPLEVAWSTLRLPGPARRRLALAAGDAMPGLLAETAAFCEARHEARAELARRWLGPALLAVAGALVLVEYAGLFGILDHARERAMPW